MTLAPVHYLRANHVERAPTDIVIFDSETRWSDTDTAQLHDLRCWVACHDRRHDERRDPPGTVWKDGTDATSLAAFITSRARSAATLWAFAHNLGFDLAATGLLDALAAAGWSTTSFAVRGDHVWFRLQKGCYRLTLTDSHSWLPHPLREIGVMLSQEKLPMPAADADPGEWVDYCGRDVAVTRAAVHGLLDYWETMGLGRWTMTGPACAWSAWRHRCYDIAPLIDPDPTLRTFERSAIYGGRREAYRVGVSPVGLYLDADFESAYPTIARDRLLPHRRLGRFPGLAPDWHTDTDDTKGWIANAIVTTDTPIAPARIGNRVCYPVGTFRTVLTSAEARSVVAAGGTVDVGTGQTYALGPLLESWGRWTLGELLPGEPDRTPLIAALHKHWGRALIGRFAARTSATRRWGDAPTQGFAVESGTDEATKGGLCWVDIGGVRWLTERDTEPENALPAVTAFVEAYCRIALNDAIAGTADTAEILQVDTDGFLVGTPSAGEWSLTVDPALDLRNYTPTTPADSGPWPDNVGGLRLTRKGAYRRVALLGPQQLWLDGRHRLSGIPRHAEATGNGDYVAHTWPGLAWQATNGTPGRYVRPLQTYPVRGPYGTRWVLADGRTAPPRLTISDGRNALDRWAGGDLDQWGPLADCSQPLLSAR